MNYNKLNCAATTKCVSWHHGCFINSNSFHKFTWHMHAADNNFKCPT